MSTTDREPPEDPRFLEGIALFNACEFYAAHDVWESLWADDRGRSRKFYQGLIQVAVALYHFGNGNLRGARKLYVSSTAYLDPFRPHHRGIDLDRFLRQLTECFSELLAREATDPKGSLDAEKIPEIELTDPPA